MPTSEMIEVIEKAKSSTAKKLHLLMPKFRIEYRHKDLLEHLKQIGLSKVFDESKCDFGNIFSKVCLDMGFSVFLHY